MTNPTQGALLTLQYLPPVQYFTKFLLHERVIIEQQEHYQKGSYRNRCHIAGPNGELRLSVPLRKGKHQRQSLREVAIAYDEPWQQHHWRGIASAYGNAPFFPYYADELAPFYEHKYTFLYDLNRKLLEKLLELLGLSRRPEWSQRYAAEAGEGVTDYREAIHPKTGPEPADPWFRPAPYPQVFQEKIGFLPNLSVIDLVFCCGPQALQFLKASIVNP